MNGPSYHNNTSITVDLETKPTMQTEQNFSLQIKKIPGKKEKKNRTFASLYSSICCPRKYPYPTPLPPHRMIFRFKRHPPLWKFQLSLRLCFFLWIFSPLGISHNVFQHVSIQVKGGDKQSALFAYNLHVNNLTVKGKYRIKK